jgi:predicted DCC family thiol-disulfide oxidoreductase YuxK
MKTLYVLYDHSCGMCCAAVDRLKREPKYVQLRVLPRTSQAAYSRFESLIDPSRPDEVIAIADTGEVYTGDAAWIMVLYALQTYRPLAMTLSSPMWRPWVGKAITIIGANRQRLSTVLGLKPDEEVIAALRSEGTAETPPCTNGACAASVPYGVLNDDRANAATTGLADAKERVKRWMCPD